jgi:2-dehydro-3-deoxygluconokinase
MTKTFLSIGECMVELSDAGSGLLRRGFAGDTFNMAWYARRLLPAQWQVSYCSCVGDDALSGEMLRFMADSGVDTTHVARLAGLSPGLYMISLKDGERSFAYWRDNSAARRLADDAARLRGAMGGADVIVYSGITLGILTARAGRELIAAAAEAKRRGVMVAFDTNYRSRLWQGRSDGAEMMLAAAAASTVVLPGLDDEQVLFGPCTAGEAARRYASLGVSTVVVKDGAKGATVLDGDELTPVVASAPREVVDTTAAGDSFAAAFLARLAGGAAAVDAARFAAGVAAEVVAARGALVDIPKSFSG